MIQKQPRQVNRINATIILKVKCNYYSLILLTNINK